MCSADCRFGKFLAKNVCTANLHATALSAGPTEVEDMIQHVLLLQLPLKRACHVSFVGSFFFEVCIELAMRLN